MQTVPRLIQTFIPENYNLSLSMDRLGRKFSGLVSVKGELPIGSDHISLHSKDLAIESALIDGKVAEFSFGLNDELKIIHPDLASGRHIVVVKFNGTITDPMHGLYPCYYEHDGIKKELLATQFESHHAREVFPCIDEPEAKATFDVCLTTETSISALGNMPITRQTTENGQLVTAFETTPKMSTYLLAWVTGELHKKSATTKDGVIVNVWATPAQTADSFDFALDTAVKSIEFYNDFFGVPYPLPKSDLVALPDFSSLAMENWGLITYREIGLLAYPGKTSIEGHQLIATAITHELAHQWFGNLVTMKWWNDLWLNESFAKLMEYMTVDHLHPEWKMWLDFATSETIYALRRDSVDGVQAVQQDVAHPDQIATLFDPAIVYAKGARLMRMLQQYVGDHDFQIGLKQYFVDFAYGNTEASDLWNAISKSSGKDVVGLMTSWIAQPGFPVINVTQNEKIITLSQERFFTTKHEPSNQTWPIPLNSSDSGMPALLSEHTITATRTTIEPLRFNNGDSAHFITHYDPTLLIELIDAVKAGKLSPLDRIQLLDEATLLANGGVMPSVELLNLVNAYREETNEHVWNIIFLALAELRKFVENDEASEKKLRALTRDIAKKEYDRLGWVAVPSESEKDTKLRSTILSMTLYGEEAVVIAKAKEMYETAGIENLDAEQRPLIISAVVRNGDAAIVDDLIKIYTTTSSSELQNDICIGITSTRIPEKIAQLLDGIKNPEIVRPQDAAHWFAYLMRGRESRSATWQWIRNNWDWVISAFGSDKSYDDYPRYSAGALSTKEHLQEYIDFFGPKKDIPALRRVIEMGISEIEGRVELIERDKAAVRQALNNL